HCAVTFDSLLWIYGGYDDNYGDDVHVFDTKKSKWEKIEYIGKDFTKRRFHIAQVYNGKMLVFGGTNTSKYYNDIIEFQLPNYSNITESNVNKNVDMKYKQLYEESLQRESKLKEENTKLLM